MRRLSLSDSGRVDSQHFAAPVFRMLPCCRTTFDLEFHGRLVVTADVQLQGGCSGRRAGGLGRHDMHIEARRAADICLTNQTLQGCYLRIGTGHRSSPGSPAWVGLV